MLFRRRVHLHSVPETSEPVYAVMQRLVDESLAKCVWPNCRHVVAFPTLMPIHNDASKLKGGLRAKLLYLFSYARGIDHTFAAVASSCHENSCSAWRKEVDLNLACAHALDSSKWAGKAEYLQADEFATGRIKYGAGEPVSKVGQQWFQSVTITDADDKVLAFFVRHVQERDKATLQPWILFFAADGCVITTDGWGGYRDLAETAASGGICVKHVAKSSEDLEKKDVTHIVVNHSENMVDTDGNHSNSVEGMHMHLKSFLAKFNRMGTTLDEVVNRVMASAFLHNPASARGPHRRQRVTHKTRFQTLLLGYKEIARLGIVPSHTLLLERSGAESPKIRTAHYSSGDRRKFFEFEGGNNESFLASPGLKRPNGLLRCLARQGPRYVGRRWSCVLPAANTSGA